MNGLKLIGIYKSFNESIVLRGIDFDVAEGEIAVLLGPSGCGKSTLLSIIAGLIPQDSGELFWNGKDLSGIPAYQRGFGLMFQDLALFPHKNVYENVAFGLRMAKFSQDQIDDRVIEVLELVGLSGFEKRDVNTLSGGEGQRVALARSLAPYPSLLMLDEPMGALDRNLRERLILELREILRKAGQTTIYVTHDQEEAFVLANRIAVMNKGIIDQFDTPQNIYLQPKTLFVAKFLGLNNLISGKVIDIGTGKIVKTQLGDYPVNGDFHNEVTILLRPDLVTITHDSECSLTGILSEISFLGGINRISVYLNNQTLYFDLPSKLHLPTPGEEIQICFDPDEAIQIFQES